VNIKGEIAKVISSSKDLQGATWRELRKVDELVDIFKSYAREIILSLENPYPEDVFLPVDQDTYEKIHEMLQKEFNMSIDRLAGHIGRKLFKGLKKSILRKIEEVEE